jgi:hypothetical protein
MRNSFSVKIRLAVCLFILTVFPTIPVWAGAHGHPAKQDTPTDPGYVFALAAASHFLHAWQTGDMSGPGHASRFAPHAQGFRNNLDRDWQERLGDR